MLYYDANPIPIVLMNCISVANGAGNGMKMMSQGVEIFSGMASQAGDLASSIGKKE